MRTWVVRQSSSILVAMAFCLALHMTGFMIILPLFARRFESFGAGVKALGVSDMAYALTSIFAAPFIGMLADRIGRRPIILLSLAGYVLAFGGYLFAASAWLLILLRGLTGIFAAGLLPAVMSIVADLTPEDRRAQWIGIVNGGASAGWIVGPLLGGLLYDRSGYVVPFTASIAMAFGGCSWRCSWFLRHTNLLLASLARTQRGHTGGKRCLPGRHFSCYCSSPLV